MRDRDRDRDRDIVASQWEPSIHATKHFEHTRVLGDYQDYRREQLNDEGPAQLGVAHNLVRHERAEAAIDVVVEHAWLAVVAVVVILPQLFDGRVDAHHDREGDQELSNVSLVTQRPNACNNASARKRTLTTWKNSKFTAHKLCG